MLPSAIEIAVAQTVRMNELTIFGFNKAKASLKLFQLNILGKSHEWGNADF